MGKSQLATVAGNIIGHVLGGDGLHDKRIRTLIRLATDQQELRKNIDPSRISSPSSSVLAPLLEAAMDESREELQALWARLLANSMIDGGSKVRREFFTTLKGMEPLDVAVMDIVAGRDFGNFKDQQDQIDAISRVLRERHVKDCGGDRLTVSLEALEASRCLFKNAGRSTWHMSAYGRQFIAACRVE